MIRRIKGRTLTRNEARWCEFSGRTYDCYDAPPSHQTVRLVAAYREIEDQRAIERRRDSWEPSRATLAAMGRRLSPVGAPIGGTKAHRRAAKRREMQARRRVSVVAIPAEDLF